MAKKSKKKRGYYRKDDIYISSYDGRRKKGKKKGKNKRRYDDDMRLKSINPSLSVKDGKRNANDIRKPVKVPKKFAKRRAKCNHADGTISVEEFKAMSVTAPAYTPILERAIEVYGAENVSICARCFDVMVNKDCISSDSCMHALVTLHASVNSAVARVKLKSDEIEALNGLKDVVDRFAPIMRILRKSESDQMRRANEGGDAAALNQATNVFVG